MSENLLIREQDEIIQVENTSYVSAPFPVGPGVKYWTESELKTKDRDGVEIKATLRQAFRALTSEPADFLTAYDKAGKRVEEALTRDGSETAITSRNRQAPVIHEFGCVDAELIQDNRTRKLNPQNLKKAQKSKGVEDYLDYEIEVVNEGGNFDFLFEEQSEFKCKITVGSKESPKFVFYVTLDKPSEDDIENHFYNYTGPPKLTRRGDLPVSETTHKTVYLVRRFNKYFSNAENVELVGGDNSARALNGSDVDRTAFLNHFDCILKAEIYSTVILRCQGDLED